MYFVLTGASICFGLDCLKITLDSSVAPRKDLLELAVAFRGNVNAWGQMRALMRWTAKQPWRKILPKTFQKLDFNYGL